MPRMPHALAGVLYVKLTLAKRGTLLFGFLGRFLFDMSHPGLKLGWSPLIKVFTGYENDGPLHYVAYEQ